MSNKHVPLIPATIPYLPDFKAEEFIEHLRTGECGLYATVRTALNTETNEREGYFPELVFCHGVRHYVVWRGQWDRDGQYAMDVAKSVELRKHDALGISEWQGPEPPPKNAPMLKRMQELREAGAANIPAIAGMADAFTRLPLFIRNCLYKHYVECIPYDMIGEEYGLYPDRIKKACNKGEKAMLEALPYQFRKTFISVAVHMATEFGPEKPEERDGNIEVSVRSGADAAATEPQPDTGEAGEDNPDG